MFFSNNFSIKVSYLQKICTSYYMLFFFFVLKGRFKNFSYPSMTTLNLVKKKSLVFGFLKLLRFKSLLLINFLKRRRFKLFRRFSRFFLRSSYFFSLVSKPKFILYNSPFYLANLFFFKTLSKNKRMKFLFKQFASKRFNRFNKVQKARIERIKNFFGKIKKSISLKYLKKEKGLLSPFTEEIGSVSKSLSGKLFKKSQLLVSRIKSHPRLVKGYKFQFRKFLKTFFKYRKKNLKFLLRRNKSKRKRRVKQVFKTYKIFKRRELRRIRDKYKRRSRYVKKKKRKYKFKIGKMKTKKLRIIRKHVIQKRKFFLNSFFNLRFLKSSSFKPFLFCLKFFSSVSSVSRKFRRKLGYALRRKYFAFGFFTIYFSKNFFFAFGSYRTLF